MAPAIASVALGVAAVAQAATMTINVTGSGQLAAGQTGNLQLTLVLLSLFAVLPFALVRSYPAPVAMIITAANVLSAAALHSLTLAGVLAQLAVLYALGAGGMQLLSALLSAAFAVLALFELAASSTVLSKGLGAGLLLLASAGPLTGWAGAALRARRAAAEHSESRLGIATVLLENTARGERARISRELHDVVAHHISMIAVQAEAARLTTTGMPPAGAERLTDIGDTARMALTEMRRLLGVLREDTGEDETGRQPQPGLAELTGLIDEAREVSRAGTRLIVSGWPAPLDPGVELTAYRIVQEALTNARRHAPGAAVDVELRFEDDILWLRIRDNGPGPPAERQSAGNGLRGMAERANAVGGCLRTGGAASGGFLVEVTLPAKALINPGTSP